MPRTLCCSPAGLLEAPTLLSLLFSALLSSTLPPTADAPSSHLMKLAKDAHACASARGDTDSPVVTIIDYSRPSTEKRLWVVDLASGRVLFHELVSHGKNSGWNVPESFSNRPESNQSSIGVFRTGEVYRGKHGRSLRLDGLEPGFNDNARKRAIVIHAADYVSPSFAERHGRLGRSHGCPALSEEIAQSVIDSIRGGTLLVAYYPDERWQAQSEYLQCGGNQLAASAR